MHGRNSLKLLAIALSLNAAWCWPTNSQPLTVSGGAPSGPLIIPMNRAVVVESREPFSELSIANPNIADISTLTDKSIYVLGKSPGRTSLTILGTDGRLISNVTVQVSPDIAEFKERLAQVLPGELIEVRTANDGVVLSGPVTSTGNLERALELAERYSPGKVSNLMIVGGTQQIMLKVRFAEMSRTVAKHLSASLAMRAGVGNPRSGGLDTGTWLSPGNSFGGGTITPRFSTEGVLGIGYTAGSFELGLLLEAMEAKGYVRTLAEPNLTALAGQEASFLAGGEYPVPVASENGQVTIQYKPFGVEMHFTPRMASNNLINLEIKAAVSGIDPSISVQSNGISISAFKRREASTIVEMRPGESFAIAGLLQDDFRNLKGQVPWVGDIPIIGALFRSSQYERRQSELLIVITPYLATPRHGSQIALPTDRIRPSSESDLFLKGKTHQDAVAEVAAQEFSGSFGYVID